MGEEDTLRPRHVVAGKIPHLAGSLLDPQQHGVAARGSISVVV
jgi:hypothetical protein